MEHSRTQELTMRDLLGIIFKHKLIIVTTFIVIMISAFLGVQFRIPMYRASVKILVTGQMQKDVEYSSMRGSSLASTQMALASSKPVIERTVKALQLDKLPIDYVNQYATKINSFFIERNARGIRRYMDEMPPEKRKQFLMSKALADLQSRISVTPVADAYIFNINVRDYDSDTAVKIANVVSRSYIIFDIEQQIAQLELIYGKKNSTIVILSNHIKKLEESLDGRLLPDIEAIGPASVKIIAQATSGELIPLKPGPLAILILAFVVSVVLGIMFAFGLEHFSQTYNSPHDVQTHLKLRNLGSIPKKRAKDHPLIEHFNSIINDYKSFYSLSEHIYLLMKDKKMRSLLITDAEGSEETAAITVNIGRYLAQKTKNKVLIIDADLRNTVISKLLNITESSNLIDVLEGKTVFENAVQEIGPNLYILPADKASFDPISLLESSTMSDIIKKASDHFDMVFINCVNLKNHTDSVLISRYVDGVALVVGEGIARRQIVMNAITPLIQKKTNIIGVILHNRTYSIPKILYDLT